MSGSSSKQLYDIWKDSPSQKAPSRFNCDLLPTASKRKVPGSVRKRSSPRPAIEAAPTTGSSYHPTNKAYGKVATKVVRNLKTLKKNEEKLNNKLSFPERLLHLKTNEATDEGWSEDEIGGEPPVKSLVLTKKPKYIQDKLSKMRKKEVRKRSNERRKAFARDVNRITKIAAKIIEKGKKRKLQKESKRKREQKEAEMAIQPMDIRYRLRNPSVLLPDQITGNLRTQTFTSSDIGNPIRDRYVSFLNRNRVLPKAPSISAADAPAQRFKKISTMRRCSFRKEILE